MLTTPAPLHIALEQLAAQYNLPHPTVDWVTETSALVDFKANGWVEASAWPAIIRCYRTVLGVTCADMPHRHPVQPGVFLLELRVSR